MQLSYIALSVFLVLIASCQSSTKAPVPTHPALTIAEATKTNAAHIARPVTDSGYNREPKFSPDGSKLLFLSSKRPSHRHAQVYELDLVRRTERRVTFNDGDDDGVSWASNKLFAYSSTTDELKEGNSAIERLKNIAQSKTQPDIKTPGGEIYIQRLDGREIERLTYSPGADISPDVDPTSNGSRIAFASARTKGSKIYLMTPNLTRLISEGKGEDSEPSFRPDGKSIAWVRSENDTPFKSRIFASEDLRTSKAITSEGFSDRQPTWHPTAGSILFSSNRSGKGFDLYLMEKAGCLKRLTTLEAEVSEPSYSPDGSKIAFVVRSGSRSGASAGLNSAEDSQIYIMEDRSNSLICL